MKTVLTAVLVLLLSGCASDQYSVTYKSDPQGASLVCNGTPMGYTPVTLYYKKTGFTRSQPCVVKWVSGAEKTVNPLTADVMVRYPDGATITSKRPDQGGYSQDAQAAQNQHYQQQQLQQQQRIINQNDDRIPDAGIKMPTYCYKFGQMVTCNN